VLLLLAQSSDSGGGASFLLFLVLYFIPTIVALARKHHNRLAIGALNLLLGWTVVGWVVALVWALTVVQRQEVS
jgi:uncharacterized membrane protein YhaH (DUF805 family)